MASSSSSSSYRASSSSSSSGSESDGEGNSKKGLEVDATDGVRQTRNSAKRIKMASAGVGSQGSPHPRLPLQCEGCPQFFYDPMGMQIHERLHSGERPYFCEQCGARFISYTYLLLHRESSHGWKMLPQRSGGEGKAKRVERKTATSKKAN